MANEFEGDQAHSAEYFGEQRNYWYNDEYLAFLRQSWNLDTARTVLDVGSGAGHWSQVIASMVAGDATLVGVDREPKWVQVATERAAAAGFAQRFRYVEGSGESLPFPDDSFDLVTCQTVLIHCPDPRAVLAEMIRVTKPGGRVLVAEPNNLTGPMLSPYALTMPVEELLTLVELEVRCERGKSGLGEGNNSYGELVPGLFAAAGLQNTQAVLNNRAVTLVPPYARPGNRAAIEELESSYAREVWMWDRATTERYFLAGGGESARFADSWSVAGRAFARLVDDRRAGTYAQAGGFVMYLVCGTKEVG
ncbi:hypothetical protein LBMAG42_43440 [Deltaproteobacteria bacterium]|nr:hypothetical protein LBMAG42_43440 [Deltaproteobacteria bacterium]